MGWNPWTPQGISRLLGSTPHDSPTDSRKSTRMQGRGYRSAARARRHAALAVSKTPREIRIAEATSIGPEVRQCAGSTALGPPLTMSHQATMTVTGFASPLPSGKMV
jgi:hypothetical protein